MTEIQDELDYAGGGLPQETNWWGAFVDRSRQARSWSPGSHL